MLKYFKRQRSRRSQDNDTNSIDGFDVPDCIKRNSLRSTSSFCDEVFFEDETTSVDTEGGCASITTMSVGAGDEDIFKYQSRLSMSLPAIVADQNCLSYFVQYLEGKNALPLIKFYLDTENFRASALTQLDIEQSARTESPFELSKTPAATDDNASKCAADNDVDNDVPELKTLCDLSMRKPLTDDEKSQIYAETNKQITIAANLLTKSSSQLELCDHAPHSTDSPPLNNSMNGDGGSGCGGGNLCATVSINDAITIYQKYLRPDAEQFVTLPVAILSQISLLLCKRDESHALPISADCFVEAQHYVLKQLETEFLNDFVQSIFYCKYCIELIESANSGLNSSKLNINDILYSEVTLFFFMEFLEQHQERDCLDFWTAAINFRKSYCSNADDMNEVYAALAPPKDEHEAQADAMIIYEKYFSLQSENRLWISDKLRCRVEQSICAAGRVANCFDLPLTVTAKYLEQKYLEQFLSSQLFENYLNELKMKVKEELAKTNMPGGVVMNGSHSKQQQAKVTQTPLKTISQQNTLLAMESHKPAPSKPSPAAASEACSSSSIDSQASASASASASSSTSTLNDLWPHAASLSTKSEDCLKFGKINALGRYERDFDDMDLLSNDQRTHTWSSLTLGGNKLKNAMRKLVNMQEDTVQEEIAWQVAEMIVKDVTAVTLSDVSSISK